VVAVVDTASRPATASVAGVQHAVSTHPVSASGIRLSGRPVSGHPGASSRASGGRPSAVHPSSVQPSAVHPVRCPAVWCLPPSIRTRPSPPMLRWWRWGPRSRRPGRGRCCRSRGWSRGVGGDPGRRVGWGPRRPRLPAERPGRPGRRPERPSRAAARWARGAGCSARWRQPPRGCRPRAGRLTTVRGRRRG
jgi:hypothetical protein